MTQQRLVSVIGFSLLAALGCSAGVDDEVGGNSTNGGNGGTAGGPTVGGNAQGGNPTSGGAGGDGAGFVTSGGSGGTGEGGAIVNPCGTECGPAELCDGINKGLDDDCDGEVDEDCPCMAGQASSCFRGDPSYRDDPGCAAGTMQCAENLQWGPCVGGKHAVMDAANPELCFSADPLGCHPINGVPFQTIDLGEGAGNFNDDADSEMYEITCPPGVDPCPLPMGADFTPLQSGEYTVEYTKVVNGVSSSCSFPLFVGARGLRVELSWNFPSSSSVDLDLHMKQPDSNADWAISGAPQDCGFANCKAFNFLGFNANSPNWFPANNVPPDPVNWYEDPVFESNLCYFAPRGEGDDWIAGNMGCHSPRLDLDNISCSVTATDPQSPSFCAPENINVDFPPKDQWMRVMVHRYSHSASQTTTPTVKIFCDGALAAELGPQGYATQPTFNQSSNNDVWLVADVLFHEDECISQCIVQPLFQAPGENPVLITETQAESTNGPPYAQNPFL
jgi:hypothetical protein